MNSGPRCLAPIFDSYISALGNEGDFYRRPLAGPKIRYSSQPVGVNILDTFMKEIANKGGLKGNFTNHSGKRTCATSLYTSGIDEQEIMARTGHRSTNAVRKYKQTSDEIRKSVSLSLDPNATFVKTQKLETANDDENKIPEATAGTSGFIDSKVGLSRARGPLSDISSSGTVNFNGCTFNFSKP